MGLTRLFSGLGVGPSTTGQVNTSSGALSLAGRRSPEEDRPHARPVLLLHRRPCGGGPSNQQSPCCAAVGEVRFPSTCLDRVVLAAIGFCVQTPGSSWPLLLLLLLHHCLLLLLQLLNLRNEQILQSLKIRSRREVMKENCWKIGTASIYESRTNVFNSLLPVIFLRSPRRNENSVTKQFCVQTHLISDELLVRERVLVMGVVVESAIRAVGLPRNRYGGAPPRRTVQSFSAAAEAVELLSQPESRNLPCSVVQQAQPRAQSRLWRTRKEPHLKSKRKLHFQGIFCQKTESEDKRNVEDTSAR